jgi:hypothetical protein
MWFVLLLLKKGMRYYGSRYRDKRGKLFGHDAGFVKRRGEMCGCDVAHTCVLKIPVHNYTSLLKNPFLSFSEKTRA